MLSQLSNQSYSRVGITLCSRNRRVPRNSCTTDGHTIAKEQVLSFFSFLFFLFFVFFFFFLTPLFSLLFPPFFLANGVPHNIGGVKWPLDPLRSAETARNDVCHALSSKGVRQRPFQEQD